MRGRQLVKDIQVLEWAIAEVEWVRESLGSLDSNARRKRSMLRWVNRQKPELRERYQRLIAARRRGKVPMSRAVGMLLPEAIGVFPGVGDMQYD